ncbi:MAG: hypothetical protein KIT17_05270 [Rubrivivax sp.]|nr:hypothetical protein [Rubrivivax sp.]
MAQIGSERARDRATCRAVIFEAERMLFIIGLVAGPLVLDGVGHQAGLAKSIQRAARHRLPGAKASLRSRHQRATASRRMTIGRPEQTTLYRPVQQQAASFIAYTEAGTGSELPRFIKDDAFLECGVLAHG